MKNNKTVWMIDIAMLSAVAVILMLLEFPLPFIAPPFYELDFSEIPVLIGTFALGPIAGVVIEAIKVLLNLVINGTITGGVGEAANFVVGVSFILPAGIIYKKYKTKKNAVVGMIAGGISMVVIACFVNAFVLIPAYGAAMGLDMDVFVKMAAAIHPSIDSLWKMIVLCVAPFNIIKAVVVSLLTTVIYKHISPVIKGKK